MAVVICGRGALGGGCVGGRDEPRHLVQGSVTRGGLSRPAGRCDRRCSQVGATTLRCCAPPTANIRVRSGVRHGAVRGLGLMPGRLRAGLSGNAQASRAWYDPSVRRLLLRRTPTPPEGEGRERVVRALVDQNFKLRRLVGLRTRDRDRWLAANSIVDGTAALASGVSAPLRVSLRSSASCNSTRGRCRSRHSRRAALSRRTQALASALRLFPQTTEQLCTSTSSSNESVHSPSLFPTRAGTGSSVASETFGELDIRSLLRTFNVPNAIAAAEGWGGGRVAALRLTDRKDDRGARFAVGHDRRCRAVARCRNGLHRGGFPRRDRTRCPPLDRCWSSSWDVASGVLGSASVFASGPGSDTIAAALFARKAKHM